MIGELAVAVLGVTVVAVGWHGLKTPGGYFQYPFLASCTMGGFALPQLIGLVSDRAVPTDAIARVAVMATLCLVSLSVGYNRSRVVTAPRSMVYDDSTLLVGAAVLTSVGAVFHIAVRLMSLGDADLFLGTGLPVALLFLGNMMYGGLALAAIYAFRHRSVGAIVITTISVLVLLERVVFLGRRSTAVALGLSLLLPRWFERGRGVPPWLVGPVLALAILANQGIGEYRAMMSGHPGAARTVVEIPFLENLEQVLAGGSYELCNASYYMDAMALRRSFDYGLYHWNAFVFNFVPGQIVGEKAKDAMMLPIAPHARLAEDVWGYVPNTGSTLTGLVDCFGSFWYFGCLKFFLIAYILRNLYDRASQRDTHAEVWYILLLVPSLLSITHNTQWFLSSVIMYGAFTLPAFWFAKRRIVGLSLPRRQGGIL